MNISCDCGTFKARLTAFPRNTPGRLVCYCRDCQSYLDRIDRRDVLDEYGGTEVIPVYPSEVEFLQGDAHLGCYRLSEHGTFRWASSCCHSPIANTRPGFPWAGIFHTACTSADPDALASLGEVRSRIYGRDAAGTPAFRISEKIAPRDMFVVMPFILKGKFLKKHRGSPFFRADSATPIREPTLLAG